MESCQNKTGDEIIIRERNVQDLANAIRAEEFRGYKRLGIAWYDENTRKHCQRMIKR